MEEELDDFIEWLRVLKLPEEDFRRHIRGYFDDTAEMEQYISTRKPQSVRYAHLDDPSTIAMSSVPTKPWLSQPADQTEDWFNSSVTADEEANSVPLSTEHKGRYKGKRRKR